MNWWPFRKKPSFATQAMQRADREIETARRYLDSQLALMNADFNARLAQMEKIAAMPVQGIVWTPVFNNYGQMLALAWKNDIETALRLLEEPAEGRA